MDNITISILLTLILVAATMAMEEITITSWNMRSMTCAGPYLHELVNKCNSDIICLAEHRLYDSELHKLNDIGLNYEYHAKASYDLMDYQQSMKVGHCGTAILWSKAIANRVRVVDCSSDRICIIELIGAFNDRSLFVVGVYLPHQQCLISSFKEQLDILAEAIDKCSIKGEVIVLGDMNCNFGVDVGERFIGRRTKNAKSLLQIIDSTGLEIIDSSNDKCSGPCYTFHVEGVGTSYIDHCLATSMAAMNTRCEVLEDGPLNTSDHLAITAKLQIGRLHNPAESNDITLQRVAWKKLSDEQIHSKYTEPLKNELIIINKKIDDIGDVKDGLTEQNVDGIIDEFIDIIHKTCDNLPQKKFNKHLKPFWSDKLKHLKNKKKVAWDKWQRVRDSEGDAILHNEYKQCKKQYRDAIKEAQFGYELKNMEELNKSNEMDIDYFWRLVNKHKNRSRIVHPLKMKDGSILTNTDDIREAWRKYFQELYTPSDDNYDSEFYKYIENELDYCLNDSNLELDDILQEVFTTDEVQKVIKSLKNNKAPGWDDITAECIKYGGSEIVKTVTKLCNLITDKEYIPWQFKIGLLIPIPKGEKNKSYQDNYRGITLLPILSKILEKCYMQRIDNWARKKGLIINVQGAMQERCSSLQSAWVVKEAIASYKEQDKPLYISLLDIRKAFDTVWQGGMLYKLHKAGLRGKLWRMIRLMYKDFICKVMITGKTSSDIDALRGIHQGAPCSMFAFVLLLNDLLTDIQNFQPGVKLCGETLNCIAFADDITIMASCKVDLQYLIDIAHKYSIKWHFSFNPTKCVVLIYGKDDMKNMDIMLGAHKLKISNSEPHLGNVLATTPALEQEYLDKRIQSCHKVSYAIQSLGSRRVPVTPVISDKLHKSVCISKLCYAVEIMDISTQGMDAMESFHTDKAKMYQGLPKHVCNVGSLLTMGWSSMRAMIEIYRLLFIWRLLLLPMACLYKVLVIRRILDLIQSPKSTKRGPVWNIIQLCQKYGLMDTMVEAVQYGNFIELSKWKAMVKDAVLTQDIKRLKVSSKIYKSISMLNVNSLQCHTMNAWWSYTKMVPSDIRNVRILMKLLLNTYRLGKDNCPVCDYGSVNSIGHILFECDILQEMRDKQWECVCEVCPNQLCMEMKNMSVYHRCTFILNALDCSLVTEWLDLYSQLVQYVVLMYKSYTKAIDTG